MAPVMYTTEYSRPCTTMSASIARGMVRDSPSVATRGVVHTTDTALQGGRKMHRITL